MARGHSELITPAAVATVPRKPLGTSATVGELVRDNRAVTTEQDTITAELIDAGRHLVIAGGCRPGVAPVALAARHRPFPFAGTATWLDRLTPDGFTELTPER